jgi:hypothetical protein
MCSTGLAISVSRSELISSSTPDLSRRVDAAAASYMSMRPSLLLSRRRAAFSSDFGVSALPSARACISRVQCYLSVYYWPWDVVLLISARGRFMRTRNFQLRNIYTTRSKIE